MYQNIKKVLITGGAGFIGANFTRYWLKHHPEDTVIVLDKLTYAGNLNNLPSIKDHPKFIFIKGDINDSALVRAIFENHHINTVVHFAGESHVDRSIDDSDAFIQTNVVGTHSLLKIAKHFWLDQWKLSSHRFHHISTDEVFGSLTPDAAPFTENHPYQPNSPYAASKAGSDHIVRAFHKTYNLNMTISHCSNNYGPYHLPEKLIPLCLIRILQGQMIPIYGDGQQSRDWLHVTDHCRGIEKIIFDGQSGESYNIGGHNGEKNNLAIVHILCDTVDQFIKTNPDLKEKYPQNSAAHGKSSRHLISHVADRLGHDRRYAIDSSKIQKQLGFHYMIDLDVGLKQTVQWYMEHDSWWKPLVETINQ